MTLTIKAIPRATKSEIVGSMADGSIKVKIAALPENGKANEELCRLLAAHYGVPRAAVTVIAGQTGTRKTVRIEGL